MLVHLTFILFIWPWTTSVFTADTACSSDFCFFMFHSLDITRSRWLQHLWLWEQDTCITISPRPASSPPWCNVILSLGFQRKDRVYFVTVHCYKFIVHWILIYSVYYSDPRQWIYFQLRVFFRPCNVCSCKIHVIPSLGCWFIFKYSHHVEPWLCII